MKKTILLLLTIIYAAPVFCQNNAGKADDLSRLVLIPYVASNSNIPSYATSVLNNKLNQIVTRHGVGGISSVPRFVITINLMEISREVTPTAPPQMSLILSPTIYIGDAQTGDLYASCQINDVKGVGGNENKAYLDAIKKINVNNPDVVQCIHTGKTRIIEYYNSNIDFILAEAESLTASQHYDDAMMLLASVPDVCKDAYEQAMKKISDVYQAKIDKEGAQLYNEAYALWSSNKSKDSALQVVELLSQINPYSSYAKQSRTLVASVEAHWSEIEDRRRALEERAWAFKMQQYQDSQAEKTAQREMNHEYRMQQSNFDYEVQMKRAETDADAANLALQEVKSVVKVMSTGQHKGGLMHSISDKISSWFR